MSFFVLSDVENRLGLEQIMGLTINDLTDLGVAVEGPLTSLEDSQLRYEGSAPPEHGILRLDSYNVPPIELEEVFEIK